MIIPYLHTCFHICQLDSDSIYMTTVILLNYMHVSCYILAGFCVHLHDVIMFLTTYLFQQMADRSYVCSQDTKFQFQF